MRSKRQNKSAIFLSKSLQTSHKKLEVTFLGNDLKFTIYLFDLKYNQFQKFKGRL